MKVNFDVVGTSSKTLSGIDRSLSRLPAVANFDRKRLERKPAANAVMTNDDENWTDADDEYYPRKELKRENKDMAMNQWHKYQ